MVKQRDYTAEAEALFERFAAKHGLSYEVETGVPMELCWKFPVQPKLSMPLTLGLQNLDELNFGVADFWSYFFPFEKVEHRFERILDAWVTGDARVAVMLGRGRLLQVRDGDEWKAVYGANGCLFPLRRWPRAIIRNGDTSDEASWLVDSQSAVPNAFWGCLGSMYAIGALLYAGVSGDWLAVPLFLGFGLFFFGVVALAKRNADRSDFSAR